jgi:hypothetical protein
MITYTNIKIKVLGTTIITQTKMVIQQSFGIIQSRCLYTNLPVIDFINLIIGRDNYLINATPFKRRRAR